MHKGIFEPGLGEGGKALAIPELSGTSSIYLGLVVEEDLGTAVAMQAKLTAPQELGAHAQQACNDYKY